MRHEENLAAVGRALRVPTRGRSKQRPYLGVFLLGVLVTLIASASVAAFAKPPLEVTLAADADTQDHVLPVTFTNTGQTVLKLLKPLDGSEHGWIMPYYQFTIVDAQGKSIPLVSRCKLFGHPYSDTKWPNDYLIVLRPGASFTCRVDHAHQIKRKGRYRVRFRYVFRPKTTRTPGGPYPAGLWRGEVQTAPAELTLPSIYPDSKEREAEARKTPLIVAIRANDLATVTRLLKQGADPNTKDRNGNPALLVALNPWESSDGSRRETSPQIVRRLLEAGADVTAKDKDGVPAIVMALEEPRQEILASLLKRGADVNARWRKGATVLMLAAEVSSPETIRFMLAHGANVHLKDDTGRTALQRTGDADVARLLKKAGAKP